MFANLAAFREPLIIAGLCLVRMNALFVIAPFLAGNVVSGMLRNAVAVSLLFAIFPLVYASAGGQAPQEPFLLAFIACKEAVLGVVIGFMTGFAFWAAQSVGYFIDNQRGVGMAQSLDPMLGETTSPLGSLLFQTLTVLFYSAGGFIYFLQLLFDSYRFWPVTSFFPAFGDREFALFFLKQADMFMAFVALLAAPIVVINLLVDIGLGLVSRFTPQLNVFFVAMPIKSGLAIFVLVLYMSTLMRALQDAFIHADVWFVVLRRVLS